ncbi:MAG TPA: protein kinase [Chloroflexia bacterium]|nr:protein kinase [Chloroflexia bacterium]
MQERPTPAGAGSAPPRDIAVDVTGNLPPGTILKRRYRILRKIAQGGMGAVYESIDTAAPHGPRWAVKEISPAALPVAERAQAIADFRREAQMLATLKHPNLPQVLETFEELGKHFLVMEFVPGRTLLNVIDGTPGFVTEERVIAWARQLFDVLNYLHSQSPPIIYRDMKPANVMLVEGTERIKLIDFGIARFHKAGKSRDTEAFGTAGYAPPEQYGKGQTDQRSDIYALAATLHHLVTEHDPSLSPFNWLPVRRYNANLSTRLESALQRALSLDPAMRFGSMRDFALAMGITLGEAPAEGVRTAASPAPAPEPRQPEHKAEPAAPRQVTVPSQPKQQTRKKQPAPPLFHPVAPVPVVAQMPSAQVPFSSAASAPTERANSGPPSHDIMAPTSTMQPVPAPQMQPTERLVVSDRLVDLGEAKWNSKPARKISLRSTGAGNVRGSVVATHPWIAYNPRHFQGNSVTLEVKVKKHELPFGRMELQVPNLFAIIWARFRRVLPLIGCWFWVLFLAASSFGRYVWYGLAGLFGALLLSEGLIWLWAKHVRMLVPTQKLNTGRLLVKSSGGEEQIDVRVMAHPSMIRRALGWVLSVVFMVAEIGVVVWGITLAFGGFGALPFTW